MVENLWIVASKFFYLNLFFISIFPQNTVCRYLDFIRVLYLFKNNYLIIINGLYTK